MASLRTGALVASLVLAFAACDEDDPTNPWGGPSVTGPTGGTAGTGSTGGMSTPGGTTGNTGATPGGTTGGVMDGGMIANPGGTTGGAMDGGVIANPGGGDGGAIAGGDGGAIAGGDGSATGDGGAMGGDGGGSTGGPLVAACDKPAEMLPPEVALPIVFVHGFAGSAQQYESQAMRFIANGYPADRIYALDHDGEGFDTTVFIDQLDALVEKARKDHSVDKVYLVGHSRGTIVSWGYLDEAHAAKVAKYISLDGLGCVLLGVPCLEPNQESLNGQAHVEVATSAESFKAQFEFLVGKPPKVVDLVAQQAPIEISGRAVNFPANTGRAGSKLEIWELNSATGQRAAGAPLATFNITESGDFGPVVVDPKKHYELLLIGSEGSNHHFYPQPFLRCDRLVRLLSGPPDSPSRMNTNAGPDHAAVVAMRMREWRQTDVLNITTNSSAGEQPAVNAIASTVNDAIALFLHDDTTTPKQSSRAELTAMTGPFQTGVDVYMPAADPPTGTITFTNMPRGDTTKPQVIRTPNWPSSSHLITVMFSDFPHQ